MASFFEKLKNSMGIEMQEEETQEPASAKPARPAGGATAGKEKQVVNKIQVKGSSAKQETHSTLREIYIKIAKVPNCKIEILVKYNYI